MSIPKKIKDSFPWFKNNKNWVYLDNSATSLKPKCVIDEITNYYEKWSCSSHNTDSQFAYRVSLKIDEVREKLAKLINAKKDEISFTSGATESLNLVANGLKEFINHNDEIIVTNGEHTSNLLPWMEVCKNKGCKLKIVGEDNQPPTEDNIINAITKKTKIIAFVNVSNLLGYELDVKKITRAARKINKNIYVVCDATQCIPHRKVDVSDMDVDFLVCSAHKMCAETGVGMLFMKSKHATKLNPIRFGGGMNNIVSCNSYTFAAPPHKFEGGTPHISGILSWGVAIDFLNKLGWDNIVKYENKLREYINKKFSQIPNINWINQYSKYPIIAFNMKNVYSQDLANYLGNKKIIVRSGLSCAKLTSKFIHEQAVVRASFYFYNDEKDVDTLVKALKEFKNKDIVSYVV